MGTVGADALVCDADGDVRLEPVELPEPGPGDVLVTTRHSGISVGTERNLLHGEVSWGPFPICTGYQAVGVVERAGAETAFEAGDRVYYRDNADLQRPDGTPIAPTSGTHCSKAVVDPEASHGFHPLPEGVRSLPASLFVLAGVGENGVDVAGVGVGDTVVVHGVGLVGLAAVAGAVRRGAEVLAADLVPERLAVAREFGAVHAVDAGERDVPEAVAETFDGAGGADVVFEATGVPDCIDTALECVRREGTFVFQGDYGDRDVSFYFRTPHHNRVTAHFPCDDGGPPCRRAVLRNMATGALPWERTVTHVVAPGEAPALYDRLTGERPDDVLGAVVDWT